LERQGREFPLASPNLRALIYSANSAPMSGVKGISLSTDSVAYAALVPKGTNYAALVPKGTNKVSSREAGTEALCSADYFHRKEKNKTPLCAKGEVTTTSPPKSFGAKFTLGGGATSIASPSEAITTDKVIFKSPVVKTRALMLEFSTLNSLIHNLLESLYENV